MTTRIKQVKTPLTREERIQEILSNLSSTIWKERAKEHGNKTLIEALVKKGVKLEQELGKIKNSNREMNDREIAEFTEKKFFSK